jgi:hypothetical protein
VASFHINLNANGGSGFQPVQAQAEAGGYQKPPIALININLRSKRQFPFVGCVLRTKNGA